MAIGNVTTNLGSLWMVALPGSWEPIIAVGTAAFFMLFILFRYTLPSRMLARLEKSLSDVESIYYNTYGDDPLKSDAEFATRLLDLQDTASVLIIRTLRSRTYLLAWSVNELRGLCNGHALAILRCSWNIHVFRNDIQIRKREKLLELNVELAAVERELPARQLALRRRYCF
ncbi:hypothetical protein C8J57DRAFT_285199 [Mycena rebaudengoi]|nr:hypothetical protein C8J57DRAFT_285199 [Mycena rebaudengoi]